MLSSVSLRARAGAIVLAALVSASVLVAVTPATADTAPASTATPETVSTDLLPTVQIDGVAWSQAIVGNTVYVGGKFTTARPAGAAAGVNTTPRSNLLAYDIRTGELITSFAPVINGQVLGVAASPDGSRLYVAGEFTSINGVGRFRVAAFDTATGTLISSFRPIVNARVNAITATATGVYFGGWFTSVDSTTRTYAAGVAPETGALLPFNPTIAGGTTSAIVASSDGSKVVVGGSFTTVNGSSNPGYGLASLDPSGALLPWSVNSLVRNGGTKASITSLSADADSVYGTGYVFGEGGTLEGAFRASWDGTLQWIEDCHGDSYGVAPVGDVVYVVSHAHYCGNIEGGFPQTEPTWTMQKAMAWTKDARGTLGKDTYGGNYYNFEGTAAPEMLNWWPDLLSGSFTGLGQAAWNVTGNDDYVVLGGEFPGVNNKPQQGLVRYAVKSIAPNKDGPRLSGASYVPTATSMAAGTARVSWLANYDRDNTRLTYELFRDGNTTTPIYTTAADSRVWFDRPQLGFTDTGLAPGSTHTYQLRVKDPFGNTVNGNAVSVQIAASGSLSDYAKTVLDDGATSFWRLGESSGSTANDWAGVRNAAYSNGTVLGASGAIAGDANTAASFDGSDDLVATQTAVQAPDTFAVESWFKTTNTSGGKIVGYGNTNSGNSGSYDRSVYMTASGRIAFGVYPGSQRVVQSAKSYNDGQWHQVVANLSKSGMQLYIDGALVGQRADTTKGQSYSGYWRIGGDSTWSGANYFRGDIDDVAVYSAPLTAAQVDSHFVESGRASTVVAPPTDSYGARVFADAPDLYWRLGESAGSVAADSGPSGNTGTYTGGVTKSVTGVVPGTNTAARFDGSTGLVSSSSTFENPQTYSLELWFSSTSTSGGKLIGFGSDATGNSGSYDRHVYLQNDGKLVFGTYTGQINTITTPESYNDGDWHQVVATQSSAGLRLYVDGELAGTNPTTSAQAYTGHWRVGGDTTWGSSSSYIDATIDEVAVYSSALSASTVAEHHTLGLGVVANVAPTAAFTSAASDLAATFDAAGSTDSDGTIAGYAWDFGDGSTATGVAPNHTFVATGTYTVTLTVTDDDGSAAVVSHPVTVTANAAPTARFTATATDLVAAFDAATSTDGDGTVTDYAWDFGDGTTGTGVSTSHTYAGAGTYLAVLTVTDDDGAISTTSRSIVATAPPVPNTAPTASFTSSSIGLSASFDASASADPDGAIASYTWSFGDGATGTGSSTTHAFTAAGTYSVTLSVTDDRGATNQRTSAVTVTAPPATNQPPVAAFTSTVNGLVLTTDATTSTDPDGAIAGVAWSFGDGAGSSGSTATHTYATAGTFTVTVTVTDDAGASSTSSRTISVSAPPTSTALAVDTFTRTATTGWGSAETGGTWTLSGAAANYAVASGGGTMSTPAGQTRSATLRSISTSDIDVTTTISLDRPATGGGVFTSVIARQIGSTAYSSRLWFQSSGAVQLQLLQGSTVLRTNVVSGLTYTAGTPLIVRTQVVGSSPTTLNAKVWRASDSEPTAWRVTSTDTTPALQGAGFLGVQNYVSGSATGGAVTVSFDDISAPPGQSTTPVTNQSPVAAFTSQAAGLTASFDASTSADPDGTVSSYSWNFGNGTTGTGATTSRTYAASGTYTVTLTVTDDRGATATRVGTVTVTAPPASNQAPVARATSTVNGLTASVDGTGSTDADGTVASYAWSFGDGGTASGSAASHVYATAGTYTVTLVVTDNAGATAQTTAQVTVAAQASGLARDAFDRTVSQGWGTADLGGAWTVSGSAANYAIAGGAATSNTAAGQTRTATLRSVSSSSTDAQTVVSLDRAATGGGTFVSLIGRQIGSGSYSARLWFQASGAVQVQVLQGSTVLRTSVVPGLTYTAGTKLVLRSTVTGTSPTTITAKVWKSGDNEPTTAQISLTDATAALQGSGFLGLQTYASGSATSAITTSFDEIVAPPGATTPTPVPNQAPVAAFSSGSNALSASFDAGTSTDPDDGISSYAWNFGDGSTGSGRTAQHAYGAAGSYTVVLTVTDTAGATATTSAVVTVTAAPAANAVPVASFTSTATDLTVTVDSGASTDQDGTIVSRAWSFGDGGVADGSTANHTYASAGTYTVTLTVTDDDGATASTTRSVTVTAAGAPVVLPIAADDFARDLAQGWGTAATSGGAWTVSGAASNYSVANGTGLSTSPAGQTRASTLRSVSATDMDLVVTTALDRTSTGGGVFVSAIGRQVGSATYSARLWFQSSGAVQLQLLQGSTVVQTSVVSGLTYTAGTPLKLRLQVVGTAPTTIRANVWKADDTEPTAWRVSMSDTTAALQTAGYIGLQTYVSASATAVPIATTFDDLLVTIPE